MKKGLAFFALLALVPAASMAGTISYVGSSTVGKFITDASKVYTASNFKIDTEPESDGGEKTAARGTSDLGGVAREVKAEYLEQGVVATLIGKDAIAAIVHRDNPVRALTSAQLKGIFTGKITNWKELGGEDLKITPYIVKSGSATRTVFGKIILGDDDYAGTEVITPDAKIPTIVAREKGAIGQISFGFIADNTQVKAVDVDGQKATVENASYPVTRPLYLVTKGAPQGEVKAFIDWALSAAGQKVVKMRFVGVR